MASQEDIRRDLERQLAVAEAARAKAERHHKPAAKPSTEPSETPVKSPEVQTVSASDGLIPWTTSLFGLIPAVRDLSARIQVGVEHRRNEYYGPVIEHIPAEEPPTTSWGKIKRGFRHAAHATFHNPVTRGISSAGHFAAHNPVADAVFRNPVSRALWRPFSLIPDVLHYSRYPLGNPGDRQNAYTHVTLNADFYLQETANVILGAPWRWFMHKLGDLGDVISDASSEKAQEILKNRWGLRWSINAAKFACTNWVSRKTAGAIYHYTCTDKAPNGERHFSPVQVANTGGFLFIGYLATLVIPIVVHPVIAVVSPFYWRWTEHSYSDVDIMDKIGPNADETWSLSIVTKQDLADAQQRRADGEHVYDDEIGRRLDIEQNWFFGIHDPRPLADMIPKLGHCDKIDAAGLYYRTPRVKIGGFRLIRPITWLAPEVVGTQNCRLLDDRPRGSLVAPQIKNLAGAYKQGSHVTIAELPAPQQKDSAVPVRFNSQTAHYAAQKVTLQSSTLQPGG